MCYTGESRVSVKEGYLQNKTMPFSLIPLTWLYMPSDTVLDKLLNCIHLCTSNLFYHTNYLALYLNSYNKH